MYEEETVGCGRARKARPLDSYEATGVNMWLVDKCAGLDVVQLMFCVFFGRLARRKHTRYLTATAVVDCLKTKRFFVDTKMSEDLNFLIITTCRFLRAKRFLLLFSTAAENSRGGRRRAFELLWADDLRAVPTISENEVCFLYAIHLSPTPQKKMHACPLSTHSTLPPTSTQNMLDNG